MRIIACFEFTVEKHPLGLALRFWNKMGTTVTLNTLKAACDILLEHMQTNFMYGRSPRSSFTNEQIEFFLCREKAGVTALAVFKVNILWKLRNAQLKGNTVGFCDVFSCFNFRACVWIFIYKSELTVIRTQEMAMLQQETNNVNCGAHVNSRGFFCVYIYWINKNGSSLLYFSLLI